MTRNLFQVLEDKVCHEPDLMVGDSLTRDKDEFCRKGRRRKHIYYPIRKIEDITKITYNLVSNSTKESTLSCWHKQCCNK